MTSEQNGFKATMGINGAQTGFLLFSVKQMDTLVASDRSCLCSRVYISAYQKDIDVLNAISFQPRLVNAVRELVWDVSRRPGILRA